MEWQQEEVARVLPERKGEEAALADAEADNLIRRRAGKVGEEFGEVLADLERPSERGAPMGPTAVWGRGGGGRPELGRGL